RDQSCRDSRIVLIKFTKNLGRLGMLPLAVQNNAKVEAWIQKDPINLNSLFESHSRFVQPIHLQVKHTEIIERPEVSRIQAKSSLKIGDRFLVLTFVGLLYGLLIRTARGRRNVNIGDVENSRRMSLLLF